MLNKLTNNKQGERMKKVNSYSDQFKYDYEFKIENKKFRFSRIKTTKFKENYKIIYFDNNAKNDQDYKRVLCCVKNLTQGVQIVKDFYKQELQGRA